jgi:hypothetical protein
VFGSEGKHFLPWQRQRGVIFLEFACRCGDLTNAQAEELDDLYDKILGQPVRMIPEPEQWTIR